MMWEIKENYGGTPEFQRKKTYPVAVKRPFLSLKVQYSTNTASNMPERSYLSMLNPVVIELVSNFSKVAYGCTFNP